MILGCFLAMILGYLSKLVYHKLDVQDFFEATTKVLLTVPIIYNHPPFDNLTLH